jgi:simple sugar transport system ATP-binding protein
LTGGRRQETVARVHESDVILEVEGIEKRFGQVVALRGASYALRTGEVHAIVGDNGAGKSTLIKIVSGVHRPDAGTISLGGNEVSVDSPRAARELGIETVYQDLALADQLDAASNLFLGREALQPWPLSWLGFLDKREMRKETSEAIRRLKVGIPSVQQPVINFSGGQRQSIAVARAIAWGRRIVIMDEPTAALGVRESQMVLEMIRDIHEHGISVIMISHNLPEVFLVADRITVMRLGQTVATLDTKDSSVEAVVGMMTGALAAQGLAS